jgi:nucleotide-binding universal stress UspA family protein
MSEKSVVVGVDGSPGARVALEYAIEEAARRGALLRVVAAVEPPELWAALYGAYVPPPRSEIIGQVRKETRRWVDEVVTARGFAATTLPISLEIRVGRPGDILVGAAEDAELLVVGHRGRGSVASVLLGSVGLHCVLHAQCPVTVVRQQPTAARVEEPIRAEGRRPMPACAGVQVAPA